MKFEKRTLENHHAKIIAEVEPEQIEKAKQRAAKKLANRMKIPGFRPGKAPYPIIERTLGKEAILEQAYEIIGEEIYPKALEETGLKPYAPAEFTPPSEESPTSFEFTFPMDAQVDLGEYRSIRIPYELPPTGEDEVEKTLTDLRERNTVIEPVERAAQVGDEITIKLSGKRTQPAENEDPTLVNEHSQTILIKAEDDPSDWPFPGFSKQLVGLSVGDEKTLTYTFPDDSAFTSLRGKEAEYSIIVEQVKSHTPPELNDEFAKSIGDFETLQALRDTILDGLKSQVKTNYDSEYSEKILAKVIEGATILYPPEMIEDQITASMTRLKNQLAEQSQEFETYLKMRGLDEADFREQNRSQAETTVKRSVIMYELAQAEAITVERDEMENESMNTLNALMRYVPPDQFKRMSKDRNFISQLSRNASVDVLTRKTFAQLMAIAKGEIETSQNATTTTAEGDISADEAAADKTAEVEATSETDSQPAEKISAEVAVPQEQESASGEIHVPETTQQEG